MPWILARRIAALFLAALSILIGLPAIMQIVWSDPSIGDSIEKNREILKEFQELAARAEPLLSLPPEYRAERAKYIPRIVRDIDIVVPTKDTLSYLASEEDIPEDDQCPDNCLILMFWRGEWYDWYLIPSGQTNVTTDYWAWRFNDMVSGAFLLIVAIFTGYIARLLWRRRPAKATEPAFKDA